MHAADYNLDEDRRAYFVVMEDMAPDFAMKDFNEGLNLEQAGSALRALAHFHALAFCYGKKKKIDFGAKYGSFLSGFFQKFDSDSQMQGFMDLNMGKILADLKGAAGGGLEDLVPRVEAMRETVAKEYARLSRRPGDERFLVHGDICSNNIMFDGGSYQCKLIDWQCLSLGSVPKDVGVLLYGSVNPETLAPNEDGLIRVYHEHFASVCAALGMGEAVPWSAERLSSEVQGDGLLATLLWAVTSYDLAGKYPRHRDRVQAIFRRGVEKWPGEV